MPNWLGLWNKELGLYWLNRIEAPLLNQIPRGSLICTASVDFICWDCAFDIVICLVLDPDSMSALYGRKSDPEAKVIPKPNYVCKTAKLIPKWAKVILT